MSGHVLVVGPYDDADTEFDIEHPADCPVEQWGDAENPHEEYTCAVGWHVMNAGIDAFFVHARDPLPVSAYVERVDEGRYAIQAWQTVHPAGPWGPEEWDGGISLAEDEEAS